MAFAASSFFGFGCKGPSSKGCYKAPFTVPAGNDFTEVRIPLGEFSDSWNSATGELTKLCKDDPSVCPSESKLKKVQRLAIWAEGVAGKVHIEFDKVSLEPPKMAGLAADVPLTTFDGAEATTQKWTAMNDPVMGGKSKATFTVEAETAVFDGAVAIVPSLQAPGFCGMQSRRETFPDISTANAIEVVARQTSDYKGWRFTIGDAPRNPDSGAPFFVKGTYKANVAIPVSQEFQKVIIPFSDFTYKWSDTTGEPTVKCVDDSSVCPTAKYLKSPKQLGIIAEGIEGSFHLEVQSIRAVSTSTIMV